MSTGESSGEAYAAMLVRSLTRRLTGVEIDAVGGATIAGAGAQVVGSLSGRSVVGLAEGLSSIPVHLRVLTSLRRRIQQGTYDLVVLIDYPGFHLRMAAAASAQGVPVLYYVAPQLWAWGSWRVASIRKHVRRMAVVLPFEEEFFKSKGIDAQFVGHPLLDRCSGPSAQEARARLHLPAGAQVLGLFPGSRTSEVKRIWPAFRDAAKILAGERSDLVVVVAAKHGLQYPGEPAFRYCREHPEAVLAAADAVLCKSGTTTLEAALARTPMVIAYRMSRLTYAVARRAVTVDHVGLVNLIAGRRVCPEFLQHDATPRALCGALRPLLDGSGDGVSRQLEAFAEVQSKLGEPGATKRVADIVERMVA